MLTDDDIRCLTSGLVSELAQDLYTLGERFCDADNVADLVSTYAFQSSPKLHDWIQEVGMKAACEKVVELFPKGIRL